MLENQHNMWISLVLLFCFLTFDTCEGNYSSLNEIISLWRGKNWLEWKHRHHHNNKSYNETYDVYRKPLEETYSTEVNNYPSITFTHFNEDATQNKCKGIRDKSCTEVICGPNKCHCYEVFPDPKVWKQQCLNGYIPDVNCHYCTSRKCVFFFCKQPSNTNFLGQSRYVLITFIVIVVLVMITIGFCAYFHDSSRSSTRTFRTRRRLTAAQERPRQSTSSTLDLLASLSDPPPSYSDIYTVSPQSRNETALSNMKLPTYEEALQISNQGSINNNCGSSSHSNSNSGERSTNHSENQRLENR